MIIVPYIQTAPLKLDHVMICWDGSRPAVRAIADAMPLLELARRVEVGNERGKQDEVEGADMGRHLARHGLNLEVKRITRGEIDIANTLLSHAAESGTDLVVMGGHGHSRLREFVLGGVTHSMLRSMTVPVLCRTNEACWLRSDSPTLPLPSRWGNLRQWPSVHQIPGTDMRHFPGSRTCVITISPAP